MAETGGLRARLPDAWMRFAVRRPRLTLALWLALCAAALPGALRLEIDTSTDSVLDRSSPEWQTYQASQDEFGGDEMIVVAFSAERPYDAEVLKAVVEFGERASELEAIRRVDSIATVPVIRIDGDGILQLDPPLEGAPENSDDLGRYVAERLRGDRIAPRSLVSEDERTFAVNLLLNRGMEDEQARLLQTLHRLADPMGGLLSGVPVFRVAANERTQTEILSFAPWTALLIALFFTWMFRTVRVVAIGVAPGAVGSFILISAMGYLGAPLSITTMVLPSIILALGCAYSMHLLSAASQARASRNQDEARRHLEAALSKVTLPVSLSGLTTVIGFIAITAVRIEAVRSTGGFGALGVLVVTAVALSVIPASLSLRPLPTPPPRGLPWLRETLAPQIVRGVIRFRGPIILAWALFSVAVGFGAAQIRVETDATHWLPPGNPVRDHYESIRQSLSGISPMNIIIEAPVGESVLEGERIAAVQALALHLEALPEVGKTISIADPLGQIHAEMVADPSAPLPTQRNLIEQYIILLESVEPIQDLISFDRSQANILIRANDNGSAHLTELADTADLWWSQNAADQGTLRTTGIMYEFARAEDRIAYGQLQGLGGALFVISGLLLLIFRWPRLALFALAPNALPLLIIFGGLGLLGIPLDAGTVLIGALALGVAVDDTIHLSTTFYDRHRRGEAAPEALAGTLAEVLPAITATTVLIAGAFFVFGFSEFTITRNLGWLTGSIMILCLLADLTLLPALLLGLKARRSDRRPPLSAETLNTKPPAH